MQHITLLPRLHGNLFMVKLKKWDCGSAPMHYFRTFWNLEEMSPEVQNRGIIDPIKRTYVLQILFKKPKLLY